MDKSENRSAEESLRILEESPYDPYDPEEMAEFLKEQIAADIYRALKARNKTQSEFAKMLGCSRQYVHQILSEKGNFTIEKLAEISSALRWRLVLRLIAPDECAPIVPVNRVDGIRSFLSGQISTSPRDSANTSVSSPVEGEVG